MKFTKLLLSAAFGAVMSAAASAATIPLPGGLIQLSDNNAESLINANGTTCAGLGSGTDCNVDVGDRLRGIFDINSIEGLNPATNPAFTPFAGQELTGIFDIVVTSVTPPAFPGGNYTIQFAASGALGAGVAIQMYTDPSLDYTRTGCATTAICEATATTERYGQLSASRLAANGVRRRSRTISL